MNSTVKWQDGTCDGKNQWVGLSWANGTLFSQLQSSSIDSHGNIDEGPSTLYLLLLSLCPCLFYMEMHSTLLPLKWHLSPKNVFLIRGNEWVYKGKVVPWKKVIRKYEGLRGKLVTNFTSFQKLVKSTLGRENQSLRNSTYIKIRALH